MKFQPFLFHSFFGLHLLLSYCPNGVSKCQLSSMFLLLSFVHEDFQLLWIYIVLFSSGNFIICFFFVYFLVFSAVYLSDLLLNKWVCLVILDSTYKHNYMVFVFFWHFIWHNTLQYSKAPRWHRGIKKNFNTVSILYATEYLR